MLLLVAALLLLVRAAISADVPIYWINLDSNPARRLSMRQHLDSLGLQHRRISALTPSTCNLLLIDNFCNSGLGVIGVLCSHINALYEAINDPRPEAKASPYVLILEDDIRFLHKVNFEELLSKLPQDFASVQLMLSHKLDIERHWASYEASLEGPSPDPALFSVRERNDTMWSAQAILYRKAAIAPFISLAVKTDRHGKRGFVLSHSFDFTKYTPSDLNPFRPTIASKCLHSDTFLYAMAQPSYVLRVPIFTSSGQGLNSTLHDEHVWYHAHGFAAIENITAILRQRPELRPSLLQPLPPHPEVDWARVARDHPVSGKGIPKGFNY